jgi:hypothetical protein
MISSPDPGYPPTAYSPSTGYPGGDLDRRFGDLGFKDEDKHRHSRSGSVTGPGIYGPSGYAAGPTGYPSTRGNTYPGAGPPNRPPSRNASPNIRPGDITGPGVYSIPLRGEPIARSSSPFGAPAPILHTGGTYPRGHIMEGQPIRSRATTPVPGTVAGSGVTGFPQATVPISAPHASVPPGHHLTDQQQLAAPEAFSRPPNAAQLYTPFDTMKVSDMDDLQDTVNRMPLVLQPHDVYNEDWIRFIQVRRAVSESSSQSQ